MAKTWIKQHELKPDPLTDCAERTLRWVRNNRDTALGAGGGALIALLFCVYFAYRWFDVRSQAWDKLAMAEAYSYANRGDLSLQAINDLRQQTPSAPAALFAGLMEGDILFRQGKYKEAAAAYRRFLDSEPPARFSPLALAGLAASQEAAGQAADAVVTYRKFLEQEPDHFLAPEMQSGLARTLEGMGEKEQAKTAYETVARLYPDTPWASIAQDKLGLAAKR